MQSLGLHTTHVVGHGGSGTSDKGMSVNQQRKIMEEIKDYKYQVGESFTSVRQKNNSSFLVLCSLKIG